MNAYSKQAEAEEARDEKLKSTKDRQFKLKLLLGEEASQYEKELKDIRLNGKEKSKTIDSLKFRIDSIKSAREEDRKKLAEERLYQHWRENNPDLRQIESKQLEKFVTNQWTDQIKEKEAALKLLDDENTEYSKYLELERQKAEDMDFELRQLKLSREIELKEILKQQMIELKQREAESEILNREEAELIQETYTVSQMNEQRKQMSQLNARQEYGNYLLRQHRAKLRHKAKEVQESLELDLRILHLIADTQEKQKHLDAERRFKAKQEANNMIHVLNEQLRLEKQREAELDSLFQDEAAREWDKRNAEWERERIARENLMKQVLDERRLQMDEKLDLLRKKKLETIQKREELIRDMERTQQLALMEKQKAEQVKLERKQDIEWQMTARKENVFNEDILRNVDEFEKEQVKEYQFRNFLDQEKVKQVQTKFEPKVRDFHV